MSDYAELGPSIRRGIRQYYQRVQPFEIKGDFNHAYWIPANWRDRIVFDREGNILRGADLEEYYWGLRKGIGYHPMFGRKFQ